VFGATDPKAGAVRSLYHVADDPRLNHRATIEGGVLADKSAALLKAFFAARRRTSAADAEGGADLVERQAYRRDDVVGRIDE
jgi:tRNA(adenine34) deaminase